MGVIRIMARIMFVYPDGKSTYGWFKDDGNDPYFEFMNQRYEIKDIAATGAIAAVNSPAILKRFNELGMPCRPTSKQHTISISVTEDTQYRMKQAAKAKNRSVSSILEELAVKWLNENGL